MAGNTDGLASYRLVERLIGREIEDCVRDTAAPEHARVHFDKMGEDKYVWLPDFELFRDIALAVADLYREPETFSVYAHEIWPYVDVYGPLSVCDVLPGRQRDRFAALDAGRIGRLLGEGETVYDRAREALVFCDGVQAADPFLTLLGGGVFANAWRAEPAAEAILPPRPALSAAMLSHPHQTPHDMLPDLLRYQVTWAAVLQEALLLKPLVEAGLARLTPGPYASIGSTRRIAKDANRAAALVAGIRASQKPGPEEVEDVYEALRVGQCLVDSSSFRHAAPYFFSADHLERAKRHLGAGMAQAAGASGVKVHSANIATSLGVRSSDMAVEDFIAIRANDDTLAVWRALRKELCRACMEGADPREASATLASEWREKVEKEKRKATSLSRRFTEQGLLFGAVGAVAAAGGAALTGTALPVLLALSAAGALTGGLGPVSEWRRARSEEEARDAARLAFERHLVAIETTGRR